MCELNEWIRMFFICSVFIFGMIESEIRKDIDGGMSGSLQEVVVIIGSPSSSPSPSDLRIRGLQGVN